MRGGADGGGAGATGRRWTLSLVKLVKLFVKLFDCLAQGFAVGRARELEPLEVAQEIGRGVEHEACDGCYRSRRGSWCGSRCGWGGALAAADLHEHLECLFRGNAA